MVYVGQNFELQLNYRAETCLPELNNQTLSASFIQLRPFIEKSLPIKRS